MDFNKKTEGIGRDIDSETGDFRKATVDLGNDFKEKTVELEDYSDQKDRESGEEKKTKEFLPEVMLRTPDEKILETGQIHSEYELMGSGINNSRYVKIKDDGAGVFKSKKDEIHTGGCEKGTLHLRERAAYLVSEMLGFDFVPPTVIREVDGQVGSLQRFIEGHNLGLDHIWDSEERRTEEFAKLLIFDYIIWNMDRHGANYLVKDERVLAIDHGNCFGNASSRFVQIRSATDTPISEELTQGLNEFMEQEDNIDSLVALLKEHISDKEIDSCVKRLKKITDIIRENKMVPAEELSNLTYN